jgi:hypothetical protein
MHLGEIITSPASQVQYIVIFWRQKMNTKSIYDIETDFEKLTLLEKKKLTCHNMISFRNYRFPAKFSGQGIKGTSFSGKYVNITYDFEYVGDGYFKCTPYNNGTLDGEPFLAHVWDDIFTQTNPTAIEKI